MSGYIEISNLNKKFKYQQIYKDMSLSLPRNGLIGFIGPSGCGKSTLLNILSGIDEDYEGIININGSILSEFTSKELDAIRIKNVGYLRQHSDLFEQETVYKNLSLPIIATTKCSKNEVNDKVLSLLNLVGLERKKNNFVFELSGGEKQRIALARSLINDPKILLADEPTGNLDAKTSKYIFKILQRLSKTILVLVVTHDQDSAKRYCDTIYEYGNYKWNKIYVSTKSNKDIKRIAPMRIKGRRKLKPKVSFDWWYSHAKRENKSHKLRNYILSFVTFISFVSIGVSVYIGTQVNNEVMLSLQQLLGREEILMKSKNDVPLIGKTTTASFNDACYIAGKYKEDVSGAGVIFDNDFNSMFIDRDLFYIDLGLRQVSMPMFSASSINKYEWVEEIPSEQTVYPYKPEFMENDQIVLGLPFAQMMQLTGELRLLKDYKYIGDYLKYKDMKMIFTGENRDWDYYDEQTFSVIGITKAKVPTIYHTNKQWNKWVLNECMCFPMKSETKFNVPWALYETPYIKLSRPQQFFNNARKSEDSDTFIFENINNLSCYKNKINQKEHKYCLFKSDKKSIKEKEYQDVLKEVGSAPNLVTSNSTYRFYPETFMKGFSFPFFVSNKSDSIDEMIDSLTSNSNEESQGEVALPDNVVKGHYLLPSCKGLTLSNDFSGLIKGRRPENLNEIVISSNLNKKLDNPKMIYVTGISDIRNDNGNIISSYGKTYLEVVGVCRGESPVFFVDSYWPIDFFKEKLNLSSLFLEPSSIILDKKSLPKTTTIELLNKLNSNYEFLNPYSKVNESLNDTMSYLKITIYSCSIGLSVVSTLLLIYIGIVTIIERKKEITTAKIIGLSANENSKMIYSFLVSIISKPFIMSIISMFVFEYIIHIAIRKQFVGTVDYFDFNFALAPFMAIFSMMVICSFIMYIFNKICVYQHLKKNRSYLRSSVIN